MLRFGTDITQQIYFHPTCSTTEGLVSDILLKLYENMSVYYCGNNRERNVTLGSRRWDKFIRRYVHGMGMEGRHSWRWRGDIRTPDSRSGLRVISIRNVSYVLYNFPSLWILPLMNAGTLHIFHRALSGGRFNRLPVAEMELKNTSASPNRFLWQRAGAGTSYSGCNYSLRWQ